MRCITLQRRAFARQGFTLAEVLITLGVIGIVAAITLPSVVGYYKTKELQTRFKKAYSVLWGVHQRMIQDYDGVYNVFIQRDTNAGSSVDQSLVAKKYEYIDAFSKYLDGARICDYQNAYLLCSSKSFLATYKTYSGNKNAYLGPDVTKDRAIVLTDGMCIFFGSASSRNARIYVDTNGTAKGPNRLGFDLFAFDISNDDKIIFPKNIGGGSAGAYEDGTVGKVNACSMKESGNIYNGFGCSEFALVDKNPDNENLSYWKTLPK